MLFRMFEELIDSPYYKEDDYGLACEEAVIILNEILRTKFLTRREYNQLLSKCYEI